MNSSLSPYTLTSSIRHSKQSNLTSKQRIKKKFNKQINNKTTIKNKH